jgi:hypothetical protein
MKATKLQFIFLLLDYQQNCVMTHQNDEDTHIYFMVPTHTFISSFDKLCDIIFEYIYVMMTQSICNQKRISTIFLFLF